MSVGGNLRILACPFYKLQHGALHQSLVITGKPHMLNTQKYALNMLGKSEVIYMSLFLGQSVLSLLYQNFMKE